MAVSALHHFLNLFLIIRHFNLFFFLFLLLRILINLVLYDGWLLIHLDVYVNLLDKLFLDPNLHHFLEHWILSLILFLISQLANEPSQTSWLALILTFFSG
jgi:hypothetical protein